MVTKEKTMAKKVTLSEDEENPKKKKDKKSEEDIKKEKIEEHFKSLKAQKTGNLYADNKHLWPEDEFVDSQCYVLNAIYSGDIFKGPPRNRVMMLAGQQAVGKTFFIIRGHVKPLVDNGIFVYYIDTENALVDSDIEAFGVNPNGFKILKVSTVEDVRKQISSIIQPHFDKFEKTKKQSDIPAIAFIMDSQGNLTTNASLAKTAEGKDTKDMTKQVELKRLYSELTVKLGLMNIPFILTNHVYANIGGYGDPLTIAGGSGALYNSSIILFLKKVKEVENGVRKGSIINIKAIKSRYVKEGMCEVSLYLSFETGFNKWYGLHLLAEKAGLLEELDEKKHTALGVVVPISGLGRKSKWVIKNPYKDASTWVVCGEVDLHKESTIGTILNPINEWVNSNFKLPKPIDFSLEEEIKDVDSSKESDISEDDLEAPEE